MVRKQIQPGVLYIISPLIFCGVIILGLVAFILYLLFKENPKSLLHNYERHVIPQKQEQVQPIQINVERGGDDRYTRAPKPLRNWLNTVDMDGSITNIPVIATRGLPESYQSMGVVTTSSGELLPLYGRRTASRSDRFNYYTRTDTNNPISLPINHKRRDCQDDIGCDELFDGDSIEIVPTKQKGSVTVYRFNGPTYIPGLI